MDSDKEVAVHQKNCKSCNGTSEVQAGCATMYNDMQVECGLDKGLARICKEKRDVLNLPDFEEPQLTQP